VIAPKLRQKLATDQISTKNEKEIHTDPTPPVYPTWQRKAHDAGVIDDDDDDRQRPEEVETGLPLSIPEPRIEIIRRSFCHLACHTPTTMLKQSR
jgi:hypothetical protein